MLEALTALLLTLALISLVAGVAARQRGLAEVLARRTEVVEARRVVRDLMDRTAASGGAVRRSDGVPTSGEVQVRLFAGWALPCGEGWWAYRGRRLPEAGRDSAWVVSSGGIVVVGVLALAARAECPGLQPEAEALRLQVDPATIDPVLIRVFEAGRFRLSDAFRYGRLDDPAQPLTGAVLDPAGSGFEISDAGFAAALQGTGDSTVVARKWPWR